MAEGRTMEASDWGNHVKAASAHAGPWPKVSIWHGSADQTVHPRNATETVKQWSTLHETSPRPNLEEKHANHIRRVWNGKDGAPAVEEYVVLEMGHGTPLATGPGDEHFGVAAPYLLEAGLSSSHRIADFWGIAEAPAAFRPSHVQASPVATGHDNVEILPRAATHLAAAERAPGRERTASQEGAHVHRADIGSIINRALKSAGLLR
jgi:feruloyl esterase